MTKGDKGARKGGWQKGGWQKGSWQGGTEGEGIGKRKGYGAYSAFFLACIMGTELLGRWMRL